MYYFFLILAMLGAALSLFVSGHMEEIKKDPFSSWQEIALIEKALIGICGLSTLFLFLGLLTYGISI